MGATSSANPVIGAIAKPTLPNDRCRSSEHDRWND
jgi:hypothetical protein